MKLVKLLFEKRTVDVDGANTEVWIKLPYNRVRYILPGSRNAGEWSIEPVNVSDTEDFDNPAAEPKRGLTDKTYIVGVGFAARDTEVMSFDAKVT